MTPIADIAHPTRHSAAGRASRAIRGGRVRAAERRVAERAALTAARERVQRELVERRLAGELAARRGAARARTMVPPSDRVVSSTLRRAMQASRTAVRRAGRP